MSVLRACPTEYTEYNVVFTRRSSVCRAVSSVVEHRLYTPAVTGSNPVPPTLAQ